MNKFYIRHIKPLIQNTATTAKWVVFASLTGTIVGLVSSAFYFVLTFVNTFREQLQVLNIRQFLFASLSSLTHYYLIYI